MSAKDELQQILLDALCAGWIKRQTFDCDRRGQMEKMAESMGLAVSSPVDIAARKLSQRRSIPGYDVVRLTMAVVLLLAAGSKGYQLSTEPVLGTGLLGSRWFLIGVVEFELFFGLWFLAGHLPSLSWAAALICFGAFAGTSLYKGMSGYASCGCFGRLTVNPWYAAGLDLAIVWFLLYWPPSPLHSPADPDTAFRWIEWPSRPFRSIGGVVAVWLFMGIPAAFTMGSYTNTTLSDTGEIVGTGDIVVLEPTTWLGKRFPLLDYIDISADLKEGRWLVLLYHHDCPKCQQAIVKLAEMVQRSSATNSVGPRLALIEMPPYGKAALLSLPPDVPFVHGRLREDKQWFVQAPLVQELSDSIVVQTDVLNQ
jgi:hypothetical protein